MESPTYDYWMFRHGITARRHVGLCMHPKCVFGISRYAPGEVVSAIKAHLRDEHGVEDPQKRPW